MKKLSALLILILMMTCVVPSAMAEKPRFHGAPEKTDSPAATPAPTREPADYGDPLLNIAVEMAYGVHELAGDEAYLSSLTYDTDFIYLPAIAATDPADLRSAQRIEVNPSLISLFFAFSGGSLTPTGEVAAAASAPGTFGSMWNAQQSQMAITEQTLCTWERTYLAPEGFSNCAMLLDCGGALYWIAFAETGDGIITVTASPMFLPEDRTAQDIFDPTNDPFPLMAPQQIYP